MRKILILLFICSVSLVSAQDKSFMENLFFNVSTDATTKRGDYEIVGLDTSFGWKFTKNFYGFATYYGGKVIYDGSEFKKNLDFTDLGVGLGYRFVSKKMGGDSFDFRASMLKSVGKSDWSNTNYNFGAYLRLKSKGVAPQFGIGFKYFDSHLIGMKSGGYFYASIGFCF